MVKHWLFYERRLRVASEVSEMRARVAGSGTGLVGGVERVEP